MRDSPSHSICTKNKQPLAKSPKNFWLVRTAIIINHISKILLYCAIYDSICPVVWAIAEYFLQLEHPRLDATEKAPGDQIKPSSTVKNIFETMFLRRCNAEPEDKDENVVEVVRPVPHWVAQLLPRHPRPGDYACNLT